MADINGVYSGTTDWQDPDVVIAQTPGFWPWDAPVDHYLPDEIRAQIRQQNADAVSTVDAVKVPYNGSTSADRTQWLNDRLTAINSRVTFIKSRVGQLLDTLKARGSDSYDAISKTVTTALSLVPVVGPVVSFVAGKADAVKAIEDYKLQALIQDYAKDLNQLAQIRAQLVSELQKAPTTTTTPAPAPKDQTDPTQKAPTPIPTWYYYAGAALLILLFLWYRRNH